MDNWHKSENEIAISKEHTFEDIEKIINLMNDYKLNVAFLIKDATKGVL